MVTLTAVRVVKDVDTISEVSSDFDEFDERVAFIAEILALNGWLVCVE